jgi:hypothetical protein
VSNAPPRAGAGAPARGTSYWGHPLESNAVELQATTEPHCSRGVQPGGARYLRARGASLADSRESGVGLAPGLQALPMPATALISDSIYITRELRAGNYGPAHPISQARKCKLSSVLLLIVVN